MEGARIVEWLEEENLYERLEDASLSARTGREWDRKVAKAAKLNWTRNRLAIGNGTKLMPGVSRDFVSSSDGKEIVIHAVVIGRSRSALSSRRVARRDCIVPEKIAAGRRE